MRGTNKVPPPPPLPSSAAPLPVPANAFANDGNFMAQFLAANPPASASSSEANGDGDSNKDATTDVVVAAAEQDDHVKQSVAKNDGSFMATFLALQHKEERRQQREKEQQLRADKDAVATQKTVSGSSDAKPKQTQQQKTDATANAGTIEQPSTKKKRSRWDAGPATSPARAAKSAKHFDEEAKAAALLADDGDLDDAREASIRAKQQKHLQELRFLEQRIRGFHQQSQLSKSAPSSKEHELAMLSEERRQEYERLVQLLEAEKAYKDSLEDAELGTIRDGTLEHRRRAREMLETLQTADALTTRAEGKHHLGDFLPQTELDKFMKEAQALTSKNRLGLESNAQLTDQQQTGGSNRTAAAASASSSTSAASRGLGHESTGQLQEDDDEFDQYRKRMMLAYRFRPNPLASLFRFIPSAMLTSLVNRALTFIACSLCSMCTE
ncbi:hypothetical protein FI667_g11144, partial [Globisporangium splendens]